MNKAFAFTVAAFSVSLMLLVAANVTQNQIIARLEGEVTLLQQKVDSLKTLVFHVCEKGPDYPYARVSNASDIYHQLLAYNKDTYEVLLMPEYNGYHTWEETVVWLTDNFGGPEGIPIMLCVFGGGENNVAAAPKLTIEQIDEAMKVANVRWLRIAEVCSWHIEHEQAFPTAYVEDLLEFAKENNLKVFWAEWKNDYLNKNHETFTQIKTVIRCYEDVVTVAFATNSGELEPVDGFLKLKDMFQNWGASIQAFYWDTRGEDLMFMPASLLLEHTFTAKELGAQIIQFEPYWYFFTNEEINENLMLLLDEL